MSSKLNTFMDFFFQLTHFVKSFKSKFVRLSDHINQRFSNCVAQNTCVPQTYVKRFARSRAWRGVAEKLLSQISKIWAKVNVFGQ